MKVAALFAAFAVSANAFAPTSSFTNSVSLSAAPRSGSALQMNAAERTYIMIKPDGVQRGIVGNIISRFESKGYKLVAMKTRKASKEILEKHYVDLVEKPFFPGMRDYMMSGPVCCMVWEGKAAVATGRKMLGETNPLNSQPGTIRGDFCIEVGRNICHGSDSTENAEKEIALWFDESELVDWESHSKDWIYE
jgi:nucleoside-diphosphate kinase